MTAGAVMRTVSTTIFVAVFGTVVAAVGTTGDDLPPQADRRNSDTARAVRCFISLSMTPL
jgi:hypothetical protein